MTATMNNKVALVTGGNSGIGRATALAFAREGAKVAVAARRNPEGEETVAMIENAGGKAIFIQADVSQSRDVEAMVEKTVEAFDHLDYACNNAGTTKRASLIDFPEADFDRIISVNLKGVWLCMKYEIPRLLDRGGGAIVNMSSDYGVVGSPRGTSAYIASKHGVIGLTKAAALEFAKENIRVNAVAPGWILTPMTEGAMHHDANLRTLMVEQEPIGRIGTPEEVAEAVVWLCSDAASFVTGHTMLVDGGITAQ
jgi:NAD(P)-dependent dehydrogenase (short-subunit alcohol dehydrogenase family)